jgi:hypothetical protein
MTSAEKETWQKVRAKGRGVFLLRHGVMKGGLVIGCVVVLLSLILSPPHTGYDVYIIAVKSAGMALALGAIDGARKWKANERAYEEIEDRPMA